MYNRDINIDNIDFTCKIIVIGNYQTGKTSLVKKYINGDFSENQYSTIGVDFRVKEIELDDTNIKLCIWDTAGQDRFMTIVSTYYKTVDGAILVFDLNNKKSFDDLKYWMEELEKNKSNKIVSFVLVGNKCDVGQHVITDDEIENFVKHFEYKISYFETSAKTGYNIEELFSRIARDIYVLNKDVINDKKKKETIQIKKDVNDSYFKYIYWNC